LLEGLVLSCELKLLDDKGAKQPFDLVGQELVLTNLIRLSLSGLGPEILLVTWKHDLQKTKTI
jgi:hypothetical protein